MKIYFSAAIINKDTKGEVYQRIIRKLEALGHVVLSYGVMDSDISFIMGQSDDDLANHYKKVLKWIGQADLVVVEASFPSTLHIGHEITLALNRNTPVIALYEKGAEPFFLTGIDSEKLSLIEYSLQDLESTLETSIDYAKDVQDTRFNFFVSPKHQHYLDFVSRTRKLPRAVFLRRLIEEEMDADDEYNSGS